MLRMIKRRAKAAGLPYSTCCHTFWATGITAYLENGGTIEIALLVDSQGGGMKVLVEMIAKALVDDPDQVTVTEQRRVECAATSRKTTETRPRSNFPGPVQP